MKLKDYKKLLAGSKAKGVIIAVGIIGIALIFFSSFAGGDGKPKEMYDIASFREDMQSSLAEMLSQIEGVGNVKVLLTVENSVEEIYLDNNSTKTKEVEPLVRGVVVACDGGDNPITAERVLDAVTKALSVSSSNVCVTKLK